MKNINSQFFTAIAKGNLKKIKDLLRRVSLFSMKDEFGDTPLHVAIMENQKEVVTFLLEEGLDPNILNKAKDTPLSNFVLNSDNREDYDSIRILLAEGGNPNYKKKGKGYSLLHESVINREVELTKLLLEHGANPNVTAGFEGFTPLHLAEDIQSAQLLIQYGADIDVEDKNHYTPLMLIVSEERSDISLELIKLFVDGKAKLINSEGKSVFFDTVAQERNQMTKLLINAGIDFREARTSLGNPMHLAASLGNLGAVEIFLEYGGNIDDNNNEKLWSPIFYAVAHGEYSVVEFLAMKGAEVNGVDASGRKLGAYTVDVKILELLRQIGYH